MRAAVTLLAVLAGCATVDDATRQQNRNELVGPPPKKAKGPCDDEREAVERANANARLYVEKCGKEIGRSANDCKNDQGKNETGICPACDALDSANAAASSAAAAFKACEKQIREGSATKAIPSEWWAAILPPSQMPLGRSLALPAAPHLDPWPGAAAR